MTAITIFIQFSLTAHHAFLSRHHLFINIIPLSYFLSIFDSRSFFWGVRKSIMRSQFLPININWSHHFSMLFMKIRKKKKNIQKKDVDMAWKDDSGWIYIFHFRFRPRIENLNVLMGWLAHLFYWKNVILCLRNDVNVKSAFCASGRD